MTETAIQAQALSGVHRSYLNEHAISDEVITAQGVYSYGDTIVFTWREGDRATVQTRAWPGKAGEYLWAGGEKGHPLHLNIIRDPAPDAPVLLCEGTKQSLAVASWAPPEYAVWGMPGCYGWVNSDGFDLARFAGRDVTILLDADAATNLDVYEAGERLALELADEEPPARPSFLPSPAWGKDGIDDYLARIAASRRTGKLVKMLTRAADKPSKTRPSHRKQGDQVPDPGDRPMVIVNQDRRDVIREILGALRYRWDGSVLFNFGGVLTRLRETQTEPLDRDAFLRWLAEGVACYSYREPTATSAGKYEPCWPDRDTTGAVLASADEFAPLSRVTSVPFIRPDGSVCAKNGYDRQCPDNPAGTGTMLITGNSGMDRLGQKGELDHPSKDDARAAASFLLGTWLGPDEQTGKNGLPFRDETSQANALALVLTPFIRGIVPLVPLAVVSGLQPGVGKGLLADCLSIMITGQPGIPLPWLPDDDDENRKQLLSAFRTGASLFCFDEAHQISGASLARALTSLTYTDRILGVSKMASYPNQVTWMALGNQVTVLADMARRAYYIELWPEGPDPQDRPESAFVHPDLRGWTLDSRPELITAALTVIRAWFTAGCPAHSRGSLMGSFEAWDKMMSGILHYAGVSGFLGNLAAKRSETDLSGGYWTEHLGWLREQFGTGEFTALNVKIRATAAGGAWDAPPRLDEPEKTGFTRNLGAAYARNQDRWFGRLRVVRAGTGHGTKALWQIQEREETKLPEAETETLPDLDGMDGMDLQGGIGAENGQDEPDESDEPHTPFAPAYAPAHTYTRAHTREERDPSVPIRSLPGFTLGCDIETADAGTLFTHPRGLAPEDGGFTRIAGVIGPTGVAMILPPADLVAMLEAASRIDGHNFLGFDGLDLAWHHGMDWDVLAPKVRDTELIARQYAPPRSREHGSEDKLGLDNVAALLGVARKTDSLARLKAKHGGYDRIPLDDPEYRAYLTGDLIAGAAVAARLVPYYDTDPYLPREHRLAQIAGHISLNGFRVDTPLLEKRLGEVNQRKADALEMLHDGWGLPLSREVMRGRGKARHAETETFSAPLTTAEGRAWLGQMWARYGVPSPPLTGTGQLAIGADDLKAVMEDPRCDASLRSMLTLMGIVTGTRTIYQTTADHLTPEGRVHPRISFRQASGRWSFTRPGLTVFGKHGGRHHERDILLPDEGHVLIACDLSQVDMRAMAALSGDRAYAAMFEPGRDAHAEIAAMVYGDPHGGHCPKDCPLRQGAKSRGHGWNYGLSARAMIADGDDPELVYGFVNGMESSFPVLIGWREEIRAMGRAGMVLDNGFGRRMMADPARAYTVAPALMGQGGARDIMGECLLRLPRELDPYLRGMIHDDVILSVPVADAEEIGHEVKRAMTWTFRDVPILCELSRPGASWGEVSA
jgi:hypothetical protein